MSPINQSTNTSVEIEKKIGAFVGAAKKKLGIESLILAFKNPALNVITTHFYNIGNRDALEIGFSIVYQMVEAELKGHPEYTEEQQLIWKNFARQFSNLIGATDAALNKINNSNAPKQ